MTNEIFEYGTSFSICDYILIHQIEELKPESLVDFGAGAGKVGKIIRGALGDRCKAIAIEGCERNAQMLSKDGFYDQVCNELLQTWITKNTMHYGLAIFGDVLEHLDPNEIHFVIKRCLRIFDHIIIQVPLHELFQKGPEWNPLETHRSYITMNTFDRYQPTEKHIVSEPNRAIRKGRRWLIMNVLLSCHLEATSLNRSVAYWAYHSSMLLLQPFGLALPFARFLEKFRG